MAAANNQTAFELAIEASSKGISEVRSVLLQNGQAQRGNNSKSAGAQRIQALLALQKQANDAFNEVIQEEYDNLKLAPEESCLKHGDIWINGILPFVGMGHYAFVAPVCHKMKDLYTTYCETEKNPPSEKSWPSNPSAPLTATMDTAIFSSVARAQHWFTHHYAGGGRFESSSICAAAAKVGNVAVLHWARLGYICVQSCCT
ncbi:expressed unknown protein [Seminavis robusta]|uniref:Uncharacterized protein n=1 Tax=Seminavis robusta TaxID=568900 RepID=A0A9N8DEA6_9STRA|nr:expressed unknown protein [Seminavis robusta]|eukprot:Sro82_g044141.1  (202) ;mRNA; f:127033-127638